MSCGVGRKHGLDLVWLWLWRRLAATAPIRPLAWEPPYAVGLALEKDKKKKRKKRKKKTTGKMDKMKIVILSYFHGVGRKGKYCYVFSSFIFFFFLTKSAAHGRFQARD